jgi:hypothetical protein
MRNAYGITITIPKAKLILGRHRHRREDSTKWILREQNDNGLDSSGSGYVPVVGFCEYDNGPPGALKGEELPDQLGNY